MRCIKEFVKNILLKRKFAHSKIYRNVNISLNSNLERDCVIFENVNIYKSNIKKYSYIQKNSSIFNSEIGAFCSIASNVTIGLANHKIDGVSTSPLFYDANQPLPKFFTEKRLEIDEVLPRTEIGDDVWIGQNVLVKAGVKVGIGAIIGAGAVVTKDVEPYSIVGGVPAKHIKFRFEKDIREKILASKWWEMEDEKLEKFSQFFDQPDEFLEKLI
jgi:acetyltransferase-like isoleucine patch superfamily enzyme